MIVVDTNVVAYLFLQGEHTKAAEDLLRREPEWSAPLLWRSELRNVLAVQMRQGRLDLERALKIQAASESILDGREYQVNSVAVLGLARDSGCTAYDCEFVALAKTLGTRLATEDRALGKAFPDLAVRIRVA